MDIGIQLADHLLAGIASKRAEQLVYIFMTPQTHYNYRKKRKNIHNIFMSETIIGVARGWCGGRGGGCTSHH